MVAVLVLGIMLASLYAGFTAGFRIIQLTREDLRATQIMLERMETIRLYRWEQLTNSSFIPTAFTNFYYPDGLDSKSAGVAYSGNLYILKWTNDLSVAYAKDMKEVRVQISWNSANTPRHREMTTYVARYGLQNYVYNPTSP